MPMGKKTQVGLSAKDDTIYKEREGEKYYGDCNGNKKQSDGGKYESGMSMTSCAHPLATETQNTSLSQSFFSNPLLPPPLSLL